MSSNNKLQGYLIVCLACFLAVVKLRKGTVKIKNERIEDWTRMIPPSPRYAEFVNVFGDHHGELRETTTLEYEIELSDYVAYEQNSSGLIKSEESLLVAFLSEECGVTPAALFGQSLILNTLLFE